MLHVSRPKQISGERIPLREDWPPIPRPLPPPPPPPQPRPPNPPPPPPRKSRSIAPLRRPHVPYAINALLGHYPSPEQTEECASAGEETLSPRLPKITVTQEGTIFSKRLSLIPKYLFPPAPPLGACHRLPVCYL